MQTIVRCMYSTYWELCRRRFDAIESTSDTFHFIDCSALLGWFFLLIAIVLLNGAAHVFSWHICFFYVFHTYFLSFRFSFTHSCGIYVCIAFVVAAFLLFLTFHFIRFPKRERKLFYEYGCVIDDFIAHRRMLKSSGSNHSIISIRSKCFYGVYWNQFRCCLIHFWAMSTLKCISSRWLISCGDVCADACVNLKLANVL